MELINYYRDKDPEKAVELAELGMKKCRDDQTDLVIFLIQRARENHDTAKEAKLLKSAKLRRAVDYSRVQKALEK